MAGLLIELPGEKLAPESLEIGKAKELYRFLEKDVYPYARVLSICRRPDASEVIIVELSVEVGQEPAHDVRAVEPIALCFSQSDDSYPDVLSLRSDFPQVPHLQLREDELPKGLCLYEEPYATVKLTWTPARFLERIRGWFRDTARGALHREDQPLEPILMPGRRHLIIPADLFSCGSSDVPEKLWIIPRAHGADGEYLVARRIDQVTPNEQRAALGYLATVFQAEPQTHGVIRKLPRTLLDMNNLLLAAGVDLLSELRSRMLSWNRGDAPLDARLILIVFFPKTRSEGKPPEVSDIWAFLTVETIRQIGAKLGYWEVARTGHVAALLGTDVDHSKASTIDVFVLNPSFALNRYGAALLSGYSPSTIRITAVGQGALGSQVILKLIRGGFGSWILIDNDYLLPHNVARHELSHSAVGFPKAAMMQVLANDILEEKAVSDAIIADILNPRDKRDQVDAALKEADVILDFSASVPMARHLANIALGPRRISAFLNPIGTDLVVLAEDSHRRTTLDCVEMQYYRELTSRLELEGHVPPDHSGRIRYAQTCRDLTSSIPEDLVGLHSATAARALRRVTADTAAAISVWRAEPNGEVKHVGLAPADMYDVQYGVWRIRTDVSLLAHLFAAREDRLPNETGGVFVGAFDLERKIVYVADFIPSPPDSKEWPVLYIRGCKGLMEDLQRIDQATGGMLQYVGEWHSHPDGCSTNPSGDDRKVFEWLHAHMLMDGLPPVMAIVGQAGNIRWFVESID